MGDSSFSVTKFFEGQHVFITGASGFIGKVLLEKLMRSCPGITRIYVLIREKKGKTASQRLQEILKLELFQKVKQEQPGALQKLTVVNGDVAEVGLRLSAEDRKMLEGKVSVVFHAAASVRFDDTLKYAVNINVRGTRDVVNLALGMKNLKVLLHVSTTYCNPDRSVIEECLYPPHGDWRQQIEVAEKFEDRHLRVLTSKIMNVHPNTYTYTKSLAEHVINDFADRIPSVIFRPSIVISSYEDPVKGWIDNFNGPIGLLTAGGKGVVHVALADPNLRADFIPVDIAVKTIIIAACVCGTNKCKSTSAEVYNCAASDRQQVSTKEMLDIGYKAVSLFPMANGIWYPFGFTTSSTALYSVSVVFLHVLPALIIDSILRLAGKKPMLLKLQRKISEANFALKRFTTNEWVFVNRKLIEIRNKILPSEEKNFGYPTGCIDVRQFLYDGIIGCKKYLLKEDDSDFSTCKAHQRRLYWLDRLTRVGFFALVVWWIVIPIVTRAWELIPTFENMMI